MTAVSVARSVARAAGASAGTASAPAQFGAEQLQNTGFADASVWEAATNWTIGSGVAAHTAGSAAALAQTFTRLPAVPHRVVFTVSGYSAGQVNLDLFDTAIPAIVVAGTARTANGTYTQDLTVPATFDRFRIKPDVNFAGSVDNVSLKRKFY